MENVVRKFIRGILSENFFDENSADFIKKYADGKVRGKTSKDDWKNIPDEEKAGRENYDFYKKEVEVKGNQIVLDVLEKGVAAGLRLKDKSTNSHFFDYITDKLAEIVQNYYKDGQNEVILDLGPNNGGVQTIGLDEVKMQNALNGLESAYLLDSPQDLLILSPTNTIIKRILSSPDERNEAMSFVNAKLMNKLTRRGKSPDSKAEKGMRKIVNQVINAYAPNSPGGSNLSALMKKLIDYAVYDYLKVKKIEQAKGEVSGDAPKGIDGNRSILDTATQGVESLDVRSKEEKIEQYLTQFGLTAIKTFKKTLDDVNFSPYKTELLLQRIFENKSSGEIAAEAIQSTKDGQPNEIGKVIINKIENLIADNKTERSFEEVLEGPEVQKMIKDNLKDTFNNFFKTKIIKDSLRGVLNSYNLPAQVSDLTVEYFFLLLVAFAQTKGSAPQASTMEKAEALVISPKKPPRIDRSNYLAGQEIAAKLQNMEILPRDLSQEEKEAVSVYNQFGKRTPNQREMAKNAKDIERYDSLVKLHEETPLEARENLTNYLREFMQSNNFMTLRDDYVEQLTNQIVDAHKKSEEFNFPEDQEGMMFAKPEEKPEEPTLEPSAEPDEELDYEEYLKQQGLENPDAELVQTTGDEYEDEYEDEYGNEYGLNEEVASNTSTTDDIDYELSMMADDSVRNILGVIQESKIVSGVLKIIKERLR